jgi:hypothetical protein
MDASAAPTVAELLTDGVVLAALERAWSAWELGVPCIIRAEDGIHTTGPDSRRGGLTGNPGFPD